MRYIVFFFLVYVFSIPTSKAQRVRWSGEKHNTWSIDIQPAALDIPLSPIAQNENGQNVFTPGYSTQIGLRYMVTHHVGIRPHYGYHRFFAQDGSGGHLNLHRAGVELVGNLSEFFPFQGGHYFRRFNALIHGGAGVTYGLNSEGAKDGIGSIMLGITPQYRLNWKLAVFADVTVHSTVRQDYGFDGKRLDHRHNGFFGSVGIGLHYYIGYHQRHVDWR